MSINANGLTTVARIKEFLGITVATYDTILESLINMTSDFISSYCNRIFQEATYTNELYDGTGSANLVLEKAPVSTSASFRLDGRDSDTNNSSWSEINNQYYHIDYSAGIVHLVGKTFAEVPNKYRMTYTAGWAFNNDGGDTLEDVGIGDLEYACWKMVAKAFNNRKGNTNVQSESIGDYQVTFRVSAMTDNEVKEILNKYIRPHRNK